MCNLRYLSFKNHITRHIGHNKKYSAIVKEVKPRRFTSSTVEELMEKNVKGSGVYRKELARGRKMKNFLNPESWQAKLSDPNITENDIKQSLISLHSPLLPRDIVDYKTRLVLHKTQFRLMINKLLFKAFVYVDTQSSFPGSRGSRCPFIKFCLFMEPTSRCLRMSVWVPSLAPNAYVCPSDFHPSLRPPGDGHVSLT